MFLPWCKDNWHIIIEHTHMETAIYFQYSFIKSIISKYSILNQSFRKKRTNAEGSFVDKSWNTVSYQIIKITKLSLYRKHITNKLYYQPHLKNTLRTFLHNRRRLHQPFTKLFAEKSPPFIQPLYRSVKKETIQVRRRGFTRAN